MFQTGSISSLSSGSPSRFILALLVALLFAACASPTSEEVNEEFDEFLSTRTACSTVDDCVMIYPGCPLGCATAVNKAFKSEAEDKAEELKSDYESGGMTCQYGCVAADLACTAGRCATVPAQF